MPAHSFTPRSLYLSFVWLKITEKDLISLSIYFCFDSVCIFFFLICRDKVLQFSDLSNIFFSFPLVFLSQRNKAIVSSLITSLCLGRNKEKGKEIKRSGTSHASLPLLIRKSFNPAQSPYSPCPGMCAQGDQLNPSYAG